ncbi:hypothetical protein LNKW23_44930 [Paralimibaculum aggregatum]|uniref:Uncharacterized protein n=1 Tax=Paralimibaculum aggregatum TaxID=3036245 RepID=A0ABQ6LT62_9RHOB|nr:hypothetical protein [Limibaculum sp. NKW23]GMG85275.1 hypothetical protein LNKW23_44930 [Limibaculum sp. NKW23]
MRSVLAAAMAATGLALAAGGAGAAEGERVQVTGEVIDTWCYYSGVMGAPEAVVGTSHHTCALWCAAGGIPVGMLAEDGTVYMIVKWKGEAAVADNTLLTVQSHELTADGILHVRDGINYLFVEEVVADAGITNETHEDYFVVPGFAIPEPE